MPVIYYTYYTREGLSIPEASERENALGRALLVRGLNELYGLRLSEDDVSSEISLSGTGKPYLTFHPDIHFNISNTDGLVACAFASSPVGADAEYPGYFAPVLIKKALSLSEQEFLDRAGTTPELHTEWFWRFWTLKEAYVKRSGIGVDTDLTAFSFTFSDIGIMCSDPEVFCYQKILPGGHILSLVLSTPPESISFVNVTFQEEKKSLPDC